MAEGPLLVVADDLRATTVAERWRPEWLLKGFSELVFQPLDDDLPLSDNGRMEPGVLYPSAKQPDSPVRFYLPTYRPRALHDSQNPSLKIHTSALRLNRGDGPYGRLTIKLEPVIPGTPTGLHLREIPHSTKVRVTFSVPMRTDTGERVANASAPRQSIEVGALQPHGTIRRVVRDVVDKAEYNSLAAALTDGTVQGQVEVACRAEIAIKSWRHVFHPGKLKLEHWQPIVDRSWLLENTLLVERPGDFRPVARSRATDVGRRIRSRRDPRFGRPTDFLIEGRFFELNPDGIGDTEVFHRLPIEDVHATAIDAGTVGFVEDAPKAIRVRDLFDDGPVMSDEILDHVRSRIDDKAFVEVVQPTVASRFADAGNWAVADFKFIQRSGEPAIVNLSATTVQTLTDFLLHDRVDLPTGGLPQDLPKPDTVDLGDRTVTVFQNAFDPAQWFYEPLVFRIGRVQGDDPGEPFLPDFAATPISVGDEEHIGWSPGMPTLRGCSPPWSRGSISAAPFRR